MATPLRRLMILGWAALALLTGASLPAAQSQPDRAEPSPKSVEAGPAQSLAAQEKQIAEKFKHLEEVLLRMAELNAAADPRRAVLLRKAVEQSKEQLIAVRLERLVELLDKDKLSRALEDQTAVDQDLRAVLELLLSENRAKHIENQRARIREFLKRINGIIQQQKDIQGRTAGGDDAKRLAGEQAIISDKTGELAKDVKTNQEAKDGKGKAGENPPGADTPSDQKPKQSPAQDRLEAAKQRMQQAENKLKQAERQGASDKQEEALRELQWAKAKLRRFFGNSARRRSSGHW
jgi:hypothetical protein